MMLTHSRVRIVAPASVIALVALFGVHSACTHAGSKTEGVQSRTQSSGSQVVVGTRAGPDFRPSQQQIVIHQGMPEPRPDLEPITDPAIDFDPSLKMTPRPPEAKKPPPAQEQPKE